MPTQPHGLGQTPTRNEPEPMSAAGKIWGHKGCRKIPNWADGTASPYSPAAPGSVPSHFCYELHGGMRGRRATLNFISLRSLPSPPWASSPSQQRNELISIPSSPNCQTFPSTLTLSYPPTYKGKGGSGSAPQHTHLGSEPTWPLLLGAP